MFGARRLRWTTLFMGVLMAFSISAVDYAEARRGGSFGSRGTRTFQSAPPTRTAPQQTAPVQRSMTPGSAQSNPSARQNPNNAQSRPGFMNNLGGALMRGLLIGGLFGLLMGHGFGGLAGMFGFLLQAFLIGGLIWFALRMFRSRQSTQAALASAGQSQAKGGSHWQMRENATKDTPTSRAFAIPSIGSSGGGNAPAAVQSREIELEPADLDVFETRLGEIQDAFSREDHATLRRLITPEMVSYLSEELGQNAQDGVRNVISDVKLLQADIAEAWREGRHDYATAALRFESRDYLVDRITGDNASGIPDVTETVELWTFVREGDGGWKLSAIQAA